MSFLFSCNLGAARDLDPGIKLRRFKASSEGRGHFYLSESIDLLGRCRAHALQARIHSKAELDIVQVQIQNAQQMGATLKQIPHSMNPIEILKRRRLRQEFVDECLRVFMRAQNVSDDIMKKILAAPSMYSGDGEVTAGSIPPDTEICGFVVPPVEDQASSEGTDSFFTAPEFAIEDPMRIPRLSGSSEPTLVRPGETPAEAEARQDSCCDRVARHLMDMTQVILREMLSSDIGEQRAETIFNNCQIAGGSSAGLLNATLNAAGSDNRGAHVETITQSLTQCDTMPSDAPEDPTS